MKGLKWAVAIFIFMALADYFSTWLLGPELLVYLETNPLYKLLGLSGLFILNLGVAGAAYYGYKLTKRRETRYSLLLCLLIISFLRIFIVWSNLQVVSNPPSIGAASAITEEVRNTYYVYKVVLPVLMAFVPGMVAFILFEKDHAEGLK